MKKIILACCFLLLTNYAWSQLTYQLSYPDSSKKLLFVKIIFNSPSNERISFVLPRFIPGNYEGKNYDRYVSDINGLATDSSVVPFEEEENGPRWLTPEKSEKSIVSVRYTVDIDRMEKEEPSSTDASIIRMGYAGLLNYSIFGFIKGHETERVTCKIVTPSSWPIFSTILPKSSPDKGTYQFACANYYQLADGQTLMGPQLRVKQYKGLVPIFVADYSEGERDYIDDIGWEAVTSLSILNDYFKSVPFNNYTVVNQHSKPQTGREEDANAMEHLNSCTFLSDLRDIETKPLDSATRSKRIFPILHHMGHAYIPLRCYGDNYKPYVLEFPVFIKNIWFNEGFIWFLLADAMKSKRLTNFILSNMDNEPIELKKLQLFDLSQLASLQYGEDFRIGVATFSRGAMMALEIDTFIKEKTNGKRSMKNVLQYLYSWAQKENRPFTMEEFPALINKAAGLDVSTVYNKWLLPLTDPIFTKNKNKSPNK